MNTRTLVVAFLGIALLICLSGVVYLAGKVPPAEIPDVLIGTTGALIGALAGILAPVPDKASAREEEM